MIVISTKCSSLALKVVILTTFSAAIEDNFIEMATFPFQWYYITPPHCIKPNRAIVAAKGYISGDEVSGRCLMALASNLKIIIITCVAPLCAKHIVTRLVLHLSPPSAAYMRQWIRSALVQIMACRLFAAKPLSKPMLLYGQLDPSEQTSVTI